MLRLPEFNMITPNTLTEALDCLIEPNTTVVAGGTDLYPNLKRRQIKFRNLISLSRLRELREISGDEKKGLVIGATVSLTEVAGNPVLKSYYPALAHAAHLVSTPQLRNAGTLGGNVCLNTRCMYFNQNELWRRSLGYCLKAFGSVCQAAPKSRRCFAVSSADTVPVLVALAARLRLRSSTGEREILIEDFYGKDGINYLTKKPDEILTAILLPPAGGLQMNYIKLRSRNAFDFPVVGVAVALEKNDANKVVRARVVLGAVESRPLLIKEAEVMMGNKLTQEIIDTVAKAAFKQARPLDNTDMGPAYRKRMARELTALALKQLV
ncbi:FAD binding domain-containing protein [Desulfoscipio gibsoniae]|uniref:Aerobic-type carbon monoxide dehydrogenase, middle subunit CoxM/CutM-like protein n=1 Tax=Desulfoscipio gibsoniae DSM 7213 TaxID=767817 RepID=R4KK55_9FIRM|nr:FAD binding domain-containing protein [Desulfoscipio gibsoniae]AGK99995.1 aerobic-type carbon monoxide dehydrogenase, middle subunit CoxM/CutM-like protein [Desulfoscipio gibsoniae DSM 7213]